jgi:hypothetical protein
MTATAKHPQTRSAQRLTRAGIGHVTHSPMKRACSIGKGQSTRKPAILLGKQANSRRVHQSPDAG